MSVNFGPKRTDMPFNETVFDEVVIDSLSGPIYDQGGAVINICGPKYRSIGTWDPVAGTGDLMAAITQALADLPANGGVIYFPPGLYRVLTLITVPGGVLFLGTSLDYAGVGPLAQPARGSVVFTDQAIAAVVQLGDDQTALTSGHTGASMEQMTVDGGSIATAAVRTFGRRTDLRFCQVYRGATAALQGDGQNTRVIYSILGQDDRGVALNVNNADFKMYGSQCRGAGAIHAVVEVLNAGVNCQLSTTHIFPNNSGPCRECVFIFGATGVQLDSLILDAGAASITIALVRMSPQSQIASTLAVTNCHGFVAGGAFPDNTIPMVSLDTSTFAIAQVLIAGNILLGNGAAQRFKSLVDTAGPAILGLLLHSNSARYCVAAFTGTTTPASHGGNVIDDGTNVLTPTDYPKKLDDQLIVNAANVTLTVPAGMAYPTLKIFFVGRSDQATGQGVTGQFNGDTGNNYDAQIQTDVNATLAGGGPFIAQPSGRMGSVAASGAAAGAEAACEITIHNADSTTLRKFWRYHDGRWDTDAVAGAVMAIGQGQWRNAANPVTSIKLIPAAGLIVSGRAILYGYP